MMSIEKIKKTTLRTKILGVVTILIVAVVCVSLIFPLAIDPSTFTDSTKRSQWIVNTIILTGLVTIGMTIFETIAQDMLKGKENGKYQTALATYSKVREEVRKYDRDFASWKKVYDKKALREAELNYLASKRIERPDLILDNIDKFNPYDLCDHQEKVDGAWQDIKGKAITLENKITLLPLEPEQVEAIMKVKEGKVGIRPFPANYYLVIDSIALNVSQVNKADTLMKAKKENQTFSRTFRIVKMLLSSTLMAMITVKDFNNLANAQAWYLLISRLMTFGSGLVAGWLSADTDVKFDIDLLNDRTAMLTMFNKDIISGAFKPKTYEEQVKEKLENDRQSNEIKLPVELHTESNA